MKEKNASAAVQRTLPRKWPHNIRDWLNVHLCTSARKTDEAALKLGAQAILAKPFTMKELQNAVRNAIHGKDEHALFDASPSQRLFRVLGFPHVFLFGHASLE